MQLFNSFAKITIVQIRGTYRLPKKLLDERVERYKGQISTYILFRPNLYNIPAFSVSSLAINIQQDQDTSGSPS